MVASSVVAAVSSSWTVSAFAAARVVRGIAAAAIAISQCLMRLRYGRGEVWRCRRWAFCKQSTRQPEPLSPAIPHILKPQALNPLATMGTPSSQPVNVNYPRQLCLPRYTTNRKCREDQYPSCTFGFNLRLPNFGLPLPVPRVNRRLIS